MEIYELIILLIVLSLSPNIDMIYGLETQIIDQHITHYINTLHFSIPVLIDLGKKGIDLNRTSILVTLLNGSREIELFYTGYPIGVENITYAYSFIYNGKDASMLTRGDVEELMKKINSGENISKLIIIKKKNIKTLLSDTSNDKIIVFIPTNYNNWYRKAIDKGFRTRLKYMYDKHVIYVYFKNKTQIFSSNKLNILYPNTELHLIYSKYIHGIRHGVLSEKIIYDENLYNKLAVAKFIKVEKYADQTIQDNWFIHFKFWNRFTSYTSYNTSCHNSILSWQLHI
jgi:hypothetical protein